MKKNGFIGYCWHAHKIIHDKLILGPYWKTYFLLDLLLLKVRIIIKFHEESGYGSIHNNNMRCKMRQW